MGDHREQGQEITVEHENLHPKTSCHSCCESIHFYSRIA